MNVINWEETLRLELIQLEQQGIDPRSLPERVRSVTGTPADLAAQCRDLYDSRSSWRRSDDYPYEEPSDLPSIEQAANFWERSGQHTVDHSRLFDQIHGAWLARAAGCLLGKPVEAWKREEIRQLLQLNGEYPLRHYFAGWYEPADSRHWTEGQYKRCAIENCAGMPRDDDMDYTILALKTIETHGRDFTTEDVARMWLRFLPAFMTFTAERAAYLNVCAGVPIPDTAVVNNPYREWIGAQIRTDLYGYICPNDPASAARMAFFDATLSHTANGIYGAMCVAAMNAAAYGLNEPEAVIRAGMAHIPQRSRLWEALDWVLQLKREESVWERAGDRLLEKYGDLNWVHTINNAAIVALALLYGERDLEKTITIAVMLGLDTDCNGATAGSIVGFWQGAKGLPDKWTGPLHDRIESYIAGEGVQNISQLALRTIALV